MLTFISPAKSLDFSKQDQHSDFSMPYHLEDSELLIRKLRTLSKKRIRSLMKISPALAELNHQRFQDWSLPFNEQNSKPAVLAFKGDVYLGLEAWDLTQPDLMYAQQHLRILSGLYGMLKPMDLIQPYRLEMGIKLPVRRKKNLYEFWKMKLTSAINVELNEQNHSHVINLASEEYFKVIDQTILEKPIITPVFKDLKNEEYKVISFFAKKARGMMSRFIIRNRLHNIQDLRYFNATGYVYDKKHSTESVYTFLRDTPLNSN